MRKRIIFPIAISFVLISLIAMAQQKLDRVIKVDGSSISGHLNSVDETTVSVGGNAIPRSNVKAILFAGARLGSGAPQVSSDTPPTDTNLTDVVVRRIGGSSYGHVSQVTGNVVVQNGNQLPRSKVASIEFNVNNAGQVITTEPAPSPSISPSPSPSPSASTSPDSGGGGAGGGSGKNDRPSADAAGAGGGKAKGAGSDNDKRLRPPWIGDSTKDRCPGEDWQPMLFQVTGAPAPNNAQPPMAQKWTDCTLSSFTICGKTLSKSIKLGRIDNSERDGCERLAAQYRGADKGVAVCCSRLKASRNRPDIGCDGTKDADCDGVPDADDDYPLDPNLPKKGNDSCSPDKLCASVTAALQYVNSAINNFQAGFDEKGFVTSMREQLGAIQDGMSACKYPRPLDPADLLRNFPEADRNLIPRWLGNIQSALKELKGNFQQSGGPCSSGTNLNSELRVGK